MPTITLAACVPFKLKPRWPSESPEKYELTDCPDCGEQMWLGLKQKAEVEAGRAQATCMLCAILKYGAGKDDPIRTLDGLNQVITEISKVDKGRSTNMSNTTTEKEEKLMVDATLAEIEVACSQVLLEYIPQRTTPDPAKVREVKAGIMSQAKRVDRSPADVALNVIRHSLDAGPDVNVEVAKAGGLLKLMESLEPTPDLANSAADSFSSDHHDESDTALVEAFKRVIDLERGVGAKPGDLHSWSQQCFGVSVANGVGFAAHISKLLEGDDERREKFIHILTKAAFAHAPEAVKEMIEPAVAQLGADKAILFLWALFNEGIKQGMIMGWRTHELAILAATEAPVEGEESSHE